MIVIPEALMREISLSPVKPISHGRHGRRVVCFPSRKNHAGVMCDSLLESDFCLELERRRSVKEYTSQPFRITENRSRVSYVPDFEVLFSNNQTTLIEVKSENRYKYGRSVEKLELFSSIFRECGYSLEIVLDSAFRHIHRTHNLRTLYHQSFTVTDTESARFEATLGNLCTRKLSIANLLASGLEPRMIAYGLFYEILLTNLDRPLTTNTAVRVEVNNEQQR
jgi:hypothetical protein